MILLGMIFIGAYGYCETNCHVECLKKSSMTVCAEKCCVYEDIFFSDGKVYYNDSGNVIEVDVEDVYFEMPEIIKTETVKVERRFGDYKAEPVRKYGETGTVRKNAGFFVKDVKMDAIPGVFLNIVQKMFRKLRIVI